MAREKKEYQTRQKQLILAMLREKQNEHVKAEQILSHLRKDGESLGLTTVYRNLEKLVQDGVIIKYVGLDGTSASYQYVGEMAAHKDHYHLVCLQCGQLVHLNCNVIDEFASHIQNDHHFQLDSMKTVFYGYCANCSDCSQTNRQDMTVAHKQESAAGETSGLPEE